MAKKKGATNKTELNQAVSSKEEIVGLAKVENVDDHKQEKIKKKKKRKLNKSITEDESQNGGDKEPVIKSLKLAKTTGMLKPTKESKKTDETVKSSKEVKEKVPSKDGAKSTKSAEEKESKPESNEKSQFKKRIKKRRRKVVLPDPEPGALEAMLLEKKENDKDAEEDFIEDEMSTTVSKKERKTPKKGKKVKAVDLVSKANFPKGKIQGKENGKAEEELQTGEDVQVHVALQYLELWKNDKSAWSFQKCRQHWLIKNMYDKTKIGDEHFDLLVEYLQGAKGMVVTKTVEEAEQFISVEGSAKKSSCKVKRMRKIVQNLVG